MHTKKTAIALLVAAALLFAAGCSPDSPESTSKGSKKSPTFSNPAVPAPPTPAASPPGNPAARAKMYSKMLDAKGAGKADAEARAAAWLALYSELEVPVYGADGEVVNGAPGGLPGPKYWNVWLASGMDRNQAHLPLSDAGRILSVTVEGADAADVTLLFIKDLRAAAKSKDKGARLMAHFVRERILRGPSKMDILARETKETDLAKNALIDPPTMQLVSWLSMRSVVFGIAAEENAKKGTGLGIDPATAASFARTLIEPLLTPSPAYAAGSFNCDELLGSKEVTAWVNKALTYVNGVLHADLPFSSFPSVRDALLSKMGVGEGKLGKISGALSYGNAMASILSLAMQVNALTLTIDSQPQVLERTKNQNPGKEQHHDIRIVFDNGDIPDAGNLRNCMMTFAANVSGVGLNFPANGSSPGKVGVEITAGDGFDRVEFADYKQIKQDADENGNVKLDIRGRGQKRDLPKSAKALDAQYSFHVSSQVEEEDLGSIGRMLFDSLVAVGTPNPANFVAPALDVLKVTKWDLGEQSFAVTDWQALAYKAHGEAGDAIFDGIICDLDKPFKLKVSGGGQNGTKSFKPNKNYPLSGGNVDLVWNWSGKIPAEGSGTYKVEGDIATGKGLQLRTDIDTVVHYPAPLGSKSKNVKGTVQLTPMESGCN